MEENQDVKKDVVDPSTEEITTEQVTDQKDISQAREDANWKEAREVMRQQQREIQELKEKLGSSSQVQHVKDNEEDELSTLASDDIITVAQARTLAKKVAKETASSLLEKREVETMEEKISYKYPDYADVIEKYIPKLIKEDPGLAEIIGHSSNPYLSAYKIAKNSYLYKQELNMQTQVNKTAQKVMENAAKPQSIHSQGYQGALSDAHNFENGLSAKRKAEIWELSQSYSARR